jgi:hypothetical protein
MGDDPVRVVFPGVIPPGGPVTLLGRLVEHVCTDRRAADIDREYRAQKRSDDLIASRSRSISNGLPVKRSAPAASARSLIRAIPLAAQPKSEQPLNVLVIVDDEDLCAHGGTITARRRISEPFKGFSGTSVTVSWPRRSTT